MELSILLQYGHIAIPGMSIWPYVLQYNTRQHVYSSGTVVHVYEYVYSSVHVYRYTGTRVLEYRYTCVRTRVACYRYILEYRYARRRVDTCSTRVRIVAAIECPIDLMDVFAIQPKYRYISTGCHQSRRSFARVVQYVHVSVRVLEYGWTGTILSIHSSRRKLGKRPASKKSKKGKSQG